MLFRSKVCYVHHNPAYNPVEPPAHPIVCTHPDTQRKMLSVSPSALSISPNLYKSVPYHPVNDFTPVGMIARTGTVLVAHPSLPVKTVKDTVALAKSRPGEFNFASGGNGTLSHLTMELFCMNTGIKVLHVPYKGSGPATTDLLAGEMHLMFHILPLSVPYVRSNKLRALAATSAERSPLLPETPTMLQAGYKDFEVTTWYGILGPAGLPRDIVNRLNVALGAAVKLPVNAKRLNDNGLDPSHGTPEADWKSTRLNSSHVSESRMPSSA